MDLLTVLAHGVGHLLGYEHWENGVMAHTLGLGVRHMPDTTLWFVDAAIVEWALANKKLGDYVAQTGTLTFAPGTTTKTITITVNGDNKKEADETLYLDLFAGSGNSLFPKSRRIGTILNDD